MLMVSSSLTTLKSVVALMRPASTRGFQDRSGDVLNIGLTAVDHVDLTLVEIDTGDRKPGFGEFHNQRQSHVA